MTTMTWGAKMVLRLRFLLILALAIGAASQVSLEASDQSDALSAAAPLKMSRTSPFSEDPHLAWRPPVVCNGDGDVFVVPVPSADPRDLKNPPAQARYTKKPSDILRVSPDGKTRLIKPATIPAFAKSGAVVVTDSIAVDPAGSLFVVSKVTRGESVNQYIVSFDSDGKYISHQEVDGDQIIIKRLEALGAGEFLLFGVRLGFGVPPQPRIAIMDARDASLRDLPAPADTEKEEDESPPAVEDQKRQEGESRAERHKSLTVSDQMVRGGDGRIYFVPQGKQSVHVIEKTGERRVAFKLASMPRSGRLRLSDLKAAGTRLVAVYYEPLPEDRANFWMDVYDVNLGERVALYGPASAPPICYQQSTTGAEQFTLMRGAVLVTVSP